MGSWLLVSHLMDCKYAPDLTLRLFSIKVATVARDIVFVFFRLILFFRRSRQHVHFIPEFRSKGAAKNGWVSSSPFTKTSNASGPFLGRMSKSFSTLFRRVASAFTSSSSSRSSTENSLGKSFIISRSRLKLYRWRRNISRCLSSISPKFVQSFSGQTTASQLFSANSLRV